VHWDRPEQFVRDLEEFMKTTRPADSPSATETEERG
jgi:hypothetical protein